MGEPGLVLLQLACEHALHYLMWFNNANVPIHNQRLIREELHHIQFGPPRLQWLYSTEMGLPLLASVELIKI